MAIVSQPHLRPAPRIQQIIAAALLALVMSATYGVRMASAEELVNALPDGVAMDGFDVVAYFEG